VYQTAAEPRYNVLSNGYQTKWHNYMEAQNWRVYTEARIEDIINHYMNLNKLSFTLSTQCERIRMSKNKSKGIPVAQILLSNTLTVKKQVDLQRGPLSLVGTTEELIGRNSSGSGPEIREYGRGIRCADDETPSIRQKFGTNFANKRRSIGRYSSLADSGNRVLVSQN
jgi:hypothetical protein